jgi:iron(III) transport system permease protein
VTQAAAVRGDPDRRIALLLLALLLVWLAVTVVLPLVALFAKSVEDGSGAFVGLDNFRRYVETPSLRASFANSLLIAFLSTALTVPLAFGYAYALTRTRLPQPGLFRSIALVPILAPSLLPAIALIYLFGNQGVLKDLLLGASIYGPGGIVAANVFYCFPHAVMILVAGLAMADRRLYEAAAALGASDRRMLFTITLPGARYALVGAAIVVFTLTLTDFGIPKVIGGRFDVLATDVYKQVIGQQNFQMGAVVGLVLLVPAALAFLVDRLVARRQAAALGARAVPYEPPPASWIDRAFLAYCLVVAALILAILGVAATASFITYWPYNLTPTWRNYAFENFDPAGWSAVTMSVALAALTAAIGTTIVFVGAWVVEKNRSLAPLRITVNAVAMLPLAVPGLVLGIGYIFFFNAPGNPLGVVYGTLAILVVNTVAHFYTVAHLTSATALKQLDPEFEAVSASLAVPLFRTFLRVTLPVCLPTVLEVATYLFVNAMTTVSALIFLYGADTKVAAVAIVNMDEAGFTAAAAAMAMIIVLVSAGARCLEWLGARLLARRFQGWRAPRAS